MNLRVLEGVEEETVTQRERVEARYLAGFSVAPSVSLSAPAGSKGRSSNFLEDLRELDGFDQQGL